MAIPFLVKAAVTTGSSKSGRHLIAIILTAILMPIILFVMFCMCGTPSSSEASESSMESEVSE